MYSSLLFFHSVFRWLVLAFLLYCIIRGYRGWKKHLPFTRLDNFMRHTTATITHIQLALGCTLYFISPITRYFMSNFKDALDIGDMVFFGLIHMLMMLTAVVLVTLGSAFAKRKINDTDKFKTMFIWFGIALLLIFMAIPWPFSPLAIRPYFRPY